MASDNSIWFRVGYALERARRPPSAAKRSLAGLAERMARPAKEKETGDSGAVWPSAEEIIDSGVVALVGRVLQAWHPRSERGLMRLLRAGAAGAGASLLLDLVRPLLEGRRELPTIDRATADRILVGIGQGLVYGAVIEPRIPGPPLLKGALYGSAEFAADPVGGLAKLLGRYSPQGKIPPVAHVLEDLDPHDREFVEHVVFGIALALLYGPSPSNNGIRMEVDGE